jgi:EmrB/QacA subfamily drug resistance transporter
MSLSFPTGPSHAAVAAPTTPEALRRRLPWLVAVALFMEHLDATVVNTAAPTMAASLAVEPLGLKGVLTSYTLALAVFIPISGWAADRFGTRRVFQAAILLFVLGSLLCGFSVNVPMLVASRLLQGAGGAMMTPVGRLALVRTFPRTEMIAAMNYVVIPALVGPLVGPFLGGLIVHWFPWRVIFFINVPLGLVGLWLTRRWMPDFSDADTPPIDWSGFLLFGSGVLALSYVLEVLGEHSWSYTATAQMLAVALALLGLYGWHSRRTRSPLLDLSLLRIRTFRVSVVGGFVTRLGIGGMPFLLPLLYQVGLGFHPWQAGLLTMPQAAAAIGMKLLSGPVLARFGHRQVLRVNTVVMGVCIAGFALVGPGTPIWAVVLLSLAQGLASSIQFTSINSLVYADVSDAAASRAGSIASTAQQLALSFGVAVGTVAAAWFLADVPQHDRLAFVQGLHRAFIVLGALTALSSLSFATLHPEDGSNVSRHRRRSGFEDLDERTT